MNIINEPKGYLSPSIEKTIVYLEHVIAASVQVSQGGDITEEWTEEIIEGDNDLFFRD